MMPDWLAAFTCAVAGHRFPPEMLRGFAEGLYTRITVTCARCGAQQHIGHDGVHAPVGRIPKRLRKRLGIG